jgi:hypothetical protein
VNVKRQMMAVFRNTVKKTTRKAGAFAGLFFPLAVHATTFGPIPVVEQAANSQYYVHGRVLGVSWVTMAPRIQRPYTYTRIQVAEQLLGEPLPIDLVVRQPGGEIGDQGYHVAGSAEFAEGEEVFIALHDVPEESAGVKEVVGLASGKFRVEQSSSGEKVVMSGLGLPVSGSDGRAFRPEEFKALLKRISNKEITEADRNVFVSRNPTHEVNQDTEARARESEAHQLRSSAPHAAPDSPAFTRKPATATNTAAPTENRVQERPSASEETSTGSSAVFWAIVAAFLLGLVGLVLALKRK